MMSKGKRQSLTATKEKLANKRNETSKRLAHCIKLYKYLHPGATDEDVAKKSKDYKTIWDSSQKDIAELSKRVKQMENENARKRKAPQAREKSQTKIAGDMRGNESAYEDDDDEEKEEEDDDDEEEDDDGDNGVTEEAHFLSHTRSTKETKLYIALQGLQSKSISNLEKSNSFNSGSGEKKCLVDSVQNNGRTFYRNHCYYYQSEGDKLIVVIIGFYSETEVCCVLVIPFSETFLGVEDEGVDYSAAFQPSPYVAVQEALDSLSLKDLGEACVDVQTIPDLKYKPEVEGDWFHFAYFYDDKRERFGKRTGPIHMVDLFAGAGIMSKGLHRSGFTTVCAVEKDSKAAHAFQLNNPEALVECMDVNSWIERCRSDDAYRDRLGPTPHIHSSSPCQGFSRANRLGGKNDKMNNELSLALLDALEVLRPTTATYENVPGMWNMKYQHYLKKLLVGLMRLGYQVRCCLLSACDFGDPQTRPRIIVFAALRCAYLPDRPPNTHGVGTSMHYVTVEDALSSGLSKSQPESVIIFRNDYPRLVPHEPAKTIKASGGPPLHYAFNRPITIEEMKALFSLPPDYQLSGREKNQRKQLGNSVPVELAAAIGKSVADVQKYNYSQEK